LASEREACDEEVVIFNIHNQSQYVEDEYNEMVIVKQGGTQADLSF
jgi:hypothetical protein